MLREKIVLNANNGSYTSLNIPLNSNFDINTSQNEAIKAAFEEIKESSINPIIDNESVRLIPSKEGLEWSVDSLIYALHFHNGTGWDESPTLLSSIGFTSEDILNRRLKIEKSFIRLSMYDSNKFKSQNLISVSNIFFDMDEIYSRYINSGLNMGQITSKFIIENPSISSKIKSFESYALYLPKFLTNKEYEFDIYMKVEFNNASNGRTTLFTHNKPDDVDGYEPSIFYENLFIPIKCKYNSSSDRYMYYVDGLDVNNSYIDNNDKNINSSGTIRVYQAKIK